MRRRVIAGGLVLAVLACAAPVQAADEMILSCMPLRAKGEEPIEAYIDGYARGGYPPAKIDSIRVLIRIGADVYEFFPPHVKELELRDGALRLHLLQPLSAGESAEMRVEGNIAAQKGAAAPMQVWFRNERREGRGDVRCTIE